MKNKNGYDLAQLKLKCDETYIKATQTQNEAEIGFCCGWLSAMCLVYAKHDKMYFKSLQIRISEILKERGLT